MSAENWVAHDAKRHFSWKQIVRRTFTFVFAPMFFLVCLGVIWKKRSDIKRNDIICSFFTWSFGHQIKGFGLMSLLLPSSKIYVIHFLHKRNNKYLSQMLPDRISSHQITLFSQCHDFFNTDCKKMFDFMMGLLFPAKFLLKDATFLYRINSLAKKSLIHFDERRKCLHPYSDLTGLVETVRRSETLAFQIPQRMAEVAELSISEVHGKPVDFSRIVVLILRKSRTEEYYDALRSCDQSNYLKAVRWLTEAGWFVMGLGETDGSLFEGIDNFIDGTRCKNPELVNLYGLSVCKFFVGLHSGAYLVPSFFKRKVILCDSFPFYIGALNEEDIILPKGVLFEGRKLALDELISRHSDAFFGKGFDSEYRLLDNTQYEILAAVKGESLVKKKFPDESLISFQNNWICEVSIED